jgi:hypothetical protein
VIHANAPLTPEGRRRVAVLVVEQRWPLRRAAARFQCSPATVKRWADRYRAGLPLTDRSSRPRRSPSRLPTRTERWIVALRFTRRWGPHRIAYHLRLARSTVGRVLARYRMPLLAHLDRSTGLPVRKPRPIRYEVAAPGLLVHVDIKKQGRIPDGGGWRIHGRGSAEDRKAGVSRTRAKRAGAAGSRGFRYLHHAVDDYSRLAYSEILNDERKDTAAAFWHRAHAFFQDAGITVTAVMTDIQAGWATSEPVRWPAGRIGCCPAPACRRCLTDRSALATPCLLVALVGGATAGVRDAMLGTRRPRQPRSRIPVSECLVRIGSSRSNGCRPR